MKLILDTNFLLIPEKHHIDIFSEFRRLLDQYEIIILEPSYKELEKLAQSNSKDGQAAKVGLALLKNKKVKIEKSEYDYADRAILKYKGDYAVATEDRELKKKLLKKGIPVIVMRKKQYLIMTKP